MATRKHGTIKLERTKKLLEESIERAKEPPVVDEDEVDLASSDSMVASDPPSFTPTTAGRPTDDEHA